MLIAKAKRAMMIICNRCEKRIKFGYSKWQSDTKIYYCPRCTIILKLKRFLQYIGVNAQENEVGQTQHELGIISNVRKEEKIMANEWTSGFVIKTPKGDYTPKSDNLEDEIKAAARYGGLKTPHVTFGFNTIEKPSDLPVACISNLEPGTSVEVSAYDFAG